MSPRWNVPPEPTYHTWSDASNTFATVRIWEEEEFAYRDATLYIPNYDARDDLCALHSQLFIVLRVRYL
jgi:hypothetical protein